MRTMYDSVTASAIPVSAAIVAGYVDGRYRWSAADWGRFPSAVKVRIACFASTNDGVVLDVETGDATPAQAPGWVRRRRAAGVDPTVYCNTSVWPQVRAAFAASGISEPHYWVAAYPGIGAALYAGSVAHQYADPATSGGNYDLSVVADIWPGVDSPAGGFGSGIGGSGTYTPLPPITSTTTPEDDMSAADVTAIMARFDNVEFLLTADTSAGPGGIRGAVQAANAAITASTTALTAAIGTVEFLLATDTSAGDGGIRGALERANADLTAIKASLTAQTPAAAPVDLAAIAKAVNDDAAKRLAS